MDHDNDAIYYAHWTVVILQITTPAGQVTCKGVQIPGTSSPVSKYLYSVPYEGFQFSDNLKTGQTDSWPAPNFHYPLETPVLSSDWSHCQFLLRLAMQKQQEQSTFNDQSDAAPLALGYERDACCFNNSPAGQTPLERVSVWPWMDSRQMCLEGRSPRWKKWCNFSTMIYESSEYKKSFLPPCVSLSCSSHYCDRHCLPKTLARSLE